MAKEPKERVHTFSNGTEYGDWEHHNCAGCWKWTGHREDDTSIKRFNCPIEKALGEAYWGDGKVTVEIATRMGLLPKRTWDCPEKEEKRPPRPRKAPALESTPLFRKE